jgi:integrase
VFFPVIDGKRTTKTIGLLRELTQEQANAKAAEIQRNLKLQAEREIITVGKVVEQYRKEKLPELRHSTQRVTLLWLKKHILPRWGEQRIIELEARPAQLWLESLPLAPKTRGHLKGLLHSLVKYAMWSKMMPLGVNPISLVTVKGSSQKVKKARSLTEEEFHLLVEHLREPFRTMVQLQLCHGLRVSELLALRWQDIDWLNSRITISHGIVNQRLDEVKTQRSNQIRTLDPRLLSILHTWKQQTEFGDAADWLFPSPVKIGRLPYSYTGYWRALQSATKRAGLGRLGTHSFRHSYRSWLGSEGFTPELQKDLMRHTDIRTTMGYGTVFSSAMEQANSKIAEKAFAYGVLTSSTSH